MRSRISPSRATIGGFPFFLAGQILSGFKRKRHAQPARSQGDDHAEVRSRTIAKCPGALSNGRPHGAQDKNSAHAVAMLSRESWRRKAGKARPSFPGQGLLRPPFGVGWVEKVLNDLQASYPPAVRPRRGRFRGNSLERDHLR